MGAFPSVQNTQAARSLYAEYYNLASPSDLTEIQRYVDRERQTLYLEGLNDVDWVFRNDILRKRGESIYVDYVPYVDRVRDEHHWHSTDPRLMRLWLFANRPRVLDVGAGHPWCRNDQCGRPFKGRGPMACLAHG